jgi:hypothetical protein
MHVDTLLKPLDAPQMMETPLIRCAHNGHFQTVKFLVSQRADVNAIDLVSPVSPASKLRLPRSQCFLLPCRGTQEQWRVCMVGPLEERKSCICYPIGAD